MNVALSGLGRFDFKKFVVGKNLLLPLSFCMVFGNAEKMIAICNEKNCI